MCVCVRWGCMCCQCRCVLVSFGMCVCILVGALVCLGVCMCWHMCMRSLCLCNLDKLSLFGIT